MAQPRDLNPEDVPNVEAAYRSLSEDLQRLLMSLAPFTAAAHPTVLKAYPFKLRHQPALACFPLARWKEVIAAAQDQGLSRPHPGEPGYWSVPPEWTAMLRVRPEYSAGTSTRLPV